MESIFREGKIYLGSIVRPPNWDIGTIFEEHQWVSKTFNIVTHQRYL